jgi:hypothetical protein
MAFSSEWAWSDSPGRDYYDYGNAALVSPPLDLTGYRGLRLRFWHRCAAEADYDFYQVKISTYGGQSWSVVALFDGPATGWQAADIPLPGLANAAQARLRYRLTADGSAQADGWQVDDIRLVGHFDRLVHGFLQLLPLLRQAP